MQSLKHGVLLGTLLIFGLLSGQVISQKSDTYCTLQISQPEQLTWSDNVSFSCQSRFYPESFFVTSFVPVTMLDIARANIDKNSFCQKRYLLSSTEVHNLLRSQYAYIVAALLKLDHLTDYGTYELWSLYKDGCKKFWKVNECEKELVVKLQERAKRRQQKKLQKEQVFVQKEKEQDDRNQKIYHKGLLDSEYQSPYHDARKQALAKTQKDNYQKYKQCRDLDAQTIGLCMAKNIDYQKLQQCTGTAMQHQLYDEVADCYKKIASFFCQPTLGQSVLAQQSLEFAQCVIGATELEAMDLAIALSDLAHGCTDLACWVVSESQEALHDFVNNISDPIGSVYKVFEIAKSAGSALGKVMNFVAEAMVHADSESLGWSHYAQVLEQEYQYDAEYAQQVVDSIKSWVIDSSAQDKVRVGTRCIVDGVLYGNLFKLLSRAGKACCGLIEGISELRSLGVFTDVYVEYGLKSDFKGVGLNGIKDVTESLLRSEVCIVHSIKPSMSWQEQAKRIASSKRLANSVNAQDALERKMRALQKAQERSRSGITKEVKLADGRIRYYEKERASKTPGPTRGSSHVTEYNSKTGQVRTWGESYDHYGNVNRINPKMINGQNLIGQHYPPTGKEIEYWKKLEKGFE